MHTRYDIIQCVEKKELILLLMHCKKLAFLKNNFVLRAFSFEAFCMTQKFKEL
jgi:hypothetical protein